MCKICEKEITFNEKHGKDNVSKHFKSIKHISKEEQLNDGPTTEFIDNALKRAEVKQIKNEYFADMTKALIEANIPIEKLNHPSFRNFLYKYNKQNVPNPTTLRNNYVPKLYKNTIIKIQESLGEYPLYLIVDESTDSRNRYVINILVGQLNGKPTKSMLVSTTFVNETNNKTVSQCILNSLKNIWPDNLHYERLYLILSDQASYMIKAIKCLKETNLFPNLHHITCIAHALNRVCCVISEENQEINSLVTLFKKILIKSPLKVIAFKEQTGLPLPPTPVKTRWGTWLKSAFYFAENYTKVKSFIENLSDSSKAIKEAKILIKSSTIENKLIEITEFEFLTGALLYFQNQGLKVSDVLEKRQYIESKLKGKALDKFKKSLNKNPDFDKFTNSDVYDFKLKTKFAPLVSVDVERSFSQYKEILSDKRQNMTQTTIEHLNVICFNDFLGFDYNK
jgi:hypothetical protein